MSDGRIVASEAPREDSERGFMPTEDELFVARQMRAGECAAFVATTPTTIRAVFLRRLLLGDASAVEPGSAMMPARLAITNAMITGSLDLRDAARSDGAALPAIELENCRIEGAVRLANASIRRIALRTCTLPELDAFGCVIEGGVEIRGIGALSAGAECFVNLEGASIGGQVRLSGARLRVAARPANDPNRKEHGVRYALNMRCCQVDDHVVLEPDVEIDGGVLLHSARVGGDIYARGATLIAGEAHALNGQGMQVTGGVSMGPATDGDTPRALDVRGTFYCGFARIDGGVYLNGARIEHASEKPEHQAALNLADTLIGGNVALFDSETWLRHRNAGSVCLDRARIEGGVYADSSAVRGVFSALDVSIAGDLRLGAARRDPLAPAPLSELGALHLYDAVIGGSLMIEGTVGEFGGEEPALAGPGARVAGAVYIRDARMRGDVDLRHVEIGRDLDLQRTTLDGDLLAKPLRVRGSVSIHQTLFGNAAQLEQASIDGDLRINQSVLRASRWHRPSMFTLQDSQIGGEVKVRYFEAADLSDDAVSSTFTAMRVRRLRCYPGWSLVEAMAEPKLIRALGGWAPRMPDERGFVGFLHRARRRGAADVVLLAGISPPIHDFNAARHLQLRNAAAAEEYLRLFTSYVWGDEGPFQIVDRHDIRVRKALQADEARIVPSMTVQCIDGERGAEFRISAPVLYEGKLYTADFAVHSDGNTVMLGDKVLFEVEDPPAPCVSPFRFAGAVADARGTTFPPSLGDGQWTTLDERARRRMAPDLVAALRPSPPEFNLRDARADRVDDDDGRGWQGRFRLGVDGFAYQRAPRDTDLERSSDLWTAENRRRPLIALQGHAAVETTCRPATKLRRRRLHSHPDWWIAEIRTMLPVDEAGQRLGAARLDPAVARFLWRPAIDDGLRVIPLSGTARNAALLERLGAPTVRGGPAHDTARDPFVPDDERAARDVLCLHWARTRTTAHLRFPAPGARVPDLDGEDRAAGTQRPRLVTFELIGEATMQRGTCRIGADGSITDASVDDAVPSAPFQVTELGPHQILRRAGKAVDPLKESPWDDGTWEVLSFADSETARRMRHEWITDAQAIFAPTSEATRVAWHPPAPLRSRLTQWLTAQLHLQPSPRVRSRLAWLGRQYEGGRVTSEAYRPHPYEVAAAAFRNEGANEDARRVLSHKLRLETRRERRGLVARTKQLFGRAFGFFFDYGLSTTRAILTTLGLFLLGWAATAHLNTAGLLVVDFEAASTMAVAAGLPNQYELGAVIGSPESAVRVLPCGRSISNPVFAADVMVPILNFGQEHRCQIASTRPAGVDQAWLMPELWKFLQTTYAVLGAICVSIMILTVSGVLRRHAES